MSMHEKIERAIDDEEGDRLAHQAADDLHGAELGAVLALLRMSRNYAFGARGFSSLTHYALSLGFCRRRARVLADAAIAFGFAPDLIDEVRSRRITIEAAAALAQVLGDPRFAAERDRWRALARETTSESLARAVRKAVAEKNAEQALEDLVLHVKPEVRDKLGRAREILSNKAGIQSALSNEEVVEFTLDYYLDHEDPDRIVGGTRRKGFTVGDPSRAIPARVKRNIIRTRGRKCQVHGCCNHLFLSFGHIRGHALGGSREEDNLLILCFSHHWMLDHGVIRFSGTAEEPVFRNRQGQVIGAARAPP